MEIVFKNLVVTRGERRILSDLSGVARPGRVLAVMGPSGQSASVCKISGGSLKAIYALELMSLHSSVWDSALNIMFIRARTHTHTEVYG